MFEEPKHITDGMKQGLARMYGDTHMREYLVNAISIAKHNSLALLGTGKHEDARDYLSRAKSLEQLLEKAKQNFIHFESVRTSKDPLKGFKVSEVKL